MIRNFQLIVLLAAPGLASCQGQPGAGVPPGLIALFEGDCPRGWTRYQPLDGRFPRGSEEGGGECGSEEHFHSFDVTARTSSDGAHLHLLAQGENIDVDSGFFGHVGVFKGYIQAFEERGHPGARARAGRARAVTDKEGGHDHLIAVQGSTGSSSCLPPCRDMIFCRKD